LDTMDIDDIRGLLPHRYPFLLVDRVLECVPGEHLIALKNVTYNEPFFAGHFPQKPVMPGVLIVEAMAQATGLLAMRTAPDLPASGEQLYYFVGIDKARFKKSVHPGDQLMLEVRLNRQKRGIWMFSGSAEVDGVVVATADLMCTSREI